MVAYNQRGKNGGCLHQSRDNISHDMKVMARKSIKAIFKSQRVDIMCGHSYKISNIIKESENY